MKRAFIFLGILVACQSGASRRGSGHKGEGEAPACPAAEHGASYTGFDGARLDDGRVNAASGQNRARLKPYSALRAEYEHALGVAPNGLDRAGAAFGDPPERFSFEPKANAVQVYSAFRLAFDGCLTYVGGFPELARAPSRETAPLECRAMAKQFWSRKATDAEVEQCAKVALVDSAAEAEPRRRWAYTCAALLSSAGFLTY